LTSQRASRHRISASKDVSTAIIISLWSHAYSTGAIVNLIIIVRIVVIVSSAF
jgi:hypothetical protein